MITLYCLLIISQKLYTVLQNLIWRIIYRTSTSFEVVQGEITEEVEKAIYVKEEHICPSFKPEVDINITNYSDTTALHYAIQNKFDLKIMSLLIDTGYNINCINKLGKTPLHVAAEVGDLAFVNLLLAKGAYVNTWCNLNYTPLHIAVNHNHYEIVNLLIQHGAIVNTVAYTVNKSSASANPENSIQHVQNCLQQYGNTPLITAVKNQSLQICRLLLENYADTNICADDGSPLYFAVQKNNKEIVLMLIDYGANIRCGNFTTTPLELAISIGSIDILNTLLLCGALNLPRYREINYIFDLAFDTHNVTIITALLQHNVQYDYENFDKVLYDFIETTSNHPNENDAEIVDLLIKYEAKVNYNDDFLMEPMELAISNGNIIIVKALLNYCSNIDEVHNNEQTYLIFAIMYREVEIIKTLISHGADVNYPNSGGETPLYIAIEYEWNEIVKILLEYGANVNYVCPDSEQSLLTNAVSKHNKVATKLLLNSGANINHVNILGRSALHEAVYNEFEDMVKILLNRHPDLNGIDVLGRTPLNSASFQNSEKIVRLLLESSANVNIIDHDGFAPLHYAILQDNVKTINLLIHYGANINVAGSSPLHFATESESKVFFSLLLFYGANVNLKRTSDNSSLLPFVLKQGYNIITEILLIHIMELKAKGLYVSSENLASFNREIKLRGSDWEEEVNNLKNKFICERFTINVYDVLTKNIYQLSKVMQNNDLRLFLITTNTRVYFNKYSEILKIRAMKSIEKADLSTNASRLLMFILNQVAMLPEEVIFKIKDCFSDKEKKDLVEQFKNIPL